MKTSQWIKIGMVVVSLFVAAVMLLGAVSPAFAQDGKPLPGEAERRPGPVQRLKERARLWPFEGDRLLQLGLVKSTQEVTGQGPRLILKGLRDGKSLAEIAAEAGKTSADILADFDRVLDERMAQAVADGKLPQPVADSRSAWYKDVARKMVILPGMHPAYPGLHELHVELITAAVRVSGVERQVLRDELKECRTLDEILQENGSSGQAAADKALQWLDTLMGLMVDHGRLDEATRQSWKTSLKITLDDMVTIPGVHVAGVECAR